MTDGITTVIFDLSEVLIYGMLGAERRVAEALSIPVEHSQLKVPELDKFFRGQIAEDGYWEAVIQHNCWKTEPQTLALIMRRNFTEIRGTRDVIEAIKRGGTRLGLLSVHGKEWIEYCESRHYYREYFDAVCYSYACGFCKPEKRAFQQCLDVLAAKPEECLFVDDKSVNVEAAKILGMKGLVFTDAHKLAEDIAKLGIL